MLPKYLITKIFLLAIVYTVTCVEYYKTPFDDLDPEVFAKDEKLMRLCIDCYLDKNPCTPTLSQIKPMIPGSLASMCEKCSPKQKLIGKRFMEEFRSRHNEEYQEFWKKYDPENKYKTPFLAVLDVPEEK